MIFYNPHQKDIKELDMDPRVLAALCCDRFLYGDHLMHIATLLNKEQGDIYCLYINYTTQIESLCERILKKQAPPKKIILMMNVGKQKNYQNGFYETYLGCDFKVGNHFSLAMIDLQKHEISHCDSLGWAIPTKVFEIAHKFNTTFYNSNSEFNLLYLHQPTSTGAHKCSSECHKGYPLQRDGNICAVVVIVMAAVAVFCPDVFQKIIEKEKFSVQHPFHEPTKFSRYLRTVVMGWFGENKITADQVVSVETGSDSISDSEVILADFEVADEKSDLIEDKKEDKVNIKG